MAKKASLGKEISILVSDKVGRLADVCDIIAAKGVNIKAAAGYVGKAGKEAELILVTDDNAAVMAALKRNGYKNVKEREVVIVELEDRPGALKGITKKLADKKINIKHIYGTTCPAGCPALIVFLTSNNKKALEAIRG